METHKRSAESLLSPVVLYHAGKVQSESPVLVVAIQLHCNVYYPTFYTEKWLPHCYTAVNIRLGIPLSLKQLSVCERSA